MVCAAMVAVGATISTSHAAEPEKPVAGKQVRFESGYGNAVPQADADGRVRQCMLVTKRTRAGAAGAVDTRFSMIISRGAGFAFGLGDSDVMLEQILGD
jgi:hypothetical protein